MDVMDVILSVLVQASEVGIDPCVEHPNRKKWSESTCQEMIYSDIFAKCREVVPEFKTYYRDCVYDSCKLVLSDLH